MTATTDDEVIYHGVYRPAGGCLILTETPAGEVTGMVAHVVKHSPTGIGWGYGGSGAADCARSLLIAALPPEQTRCPECAGTGYTVADPANGYEPRPYDRARDGDLDEMHPELWGKCWCEHGWRHLPYQDFKWNVVAKWPQSPGEWRMSRSEIRAWVAARDPEGGSS